PRKTDMDASYFELGKKLLRAKKEKACARVAFATHDVAMIRRLSEQASKEGFSKGDFEVQMLYGIQRGEQERLAADGCTSIVLVAYGTFWYPWFVRRLAERPANLWFIARNVFASQRGLVCFVSSSRASIEKTFLGTILHRRRGERERGPHHVPWRVSETGTNHFWQELRPGIRRKGREPGGGRTLVWSQRGDGGESRERFVWPGNDQEFPVAGN